MVPNGMLAEGGFTAMDTSCAGVTVNRVEPLMLLRVALMVAVPTAALLASPLLLIVADDCVSELQVAVEVRFCVLPSVKLPVATNCCVVPSAIEGFPGVTAMETSAAELTVNAVEPCTDPEIALMLAEPVATLLANPWLPALLLMVATEVVSELHCTVAVMFCMLPSVKVPVAVNWTVVPRGMPGIAGVIAMVTSAAGFTTSVVDPVIAPNVAVTIVLPTATLAAIP